ncbi:MAG: lipopolysaccharide transport system permease protein [Psychroserpens sp.]|jgi:lipopolysaccharide transport system permease protein
MKSIEQDWDLIVKPKRHLLDINLKEIWDYRDLVLLFVRRDFVANFKQTILGPFWFFLGPLLSTLVYTIVFNNIAKIPTDGAPPVLFYLSGIVGWNYFAACLNGTANTFSANAGIFGKVYFPRLVSPFSKIISNLIQFGIQFSLLVIVMIAFKVSEGQFYFNKTALLLPIYLFILSLIGLGFGVIISSLTVKYRDLTQLMGFGMQLFMYATPIIYPSSMVPEKYKFIVLLNPVAPVIESLKYGLLGTGSFNGLGLAYSTIIGLILLSIGVILFNKVEQTFMDTV